MGAVGGAGCLFDLDDFEITPSPNQIPTTIIRTAAPLLDEVVSILVIGEMSDVSHMVVERWCKSAHALHHTVCQVWVEPGGHPSSTHLNSSLQEMTRLLINTLRVTAQGIFKNYPQSYRSLGT